MKITLTGADERTPLDDLVRLADAGAEIGLLCTYDPEGRHRYPSWAWLLKAVNVLRERCAVHVCGRRAVTGLIFGMLNDLLSLAGRIQVNGILNPDDVASVCNEWASKTIITQHHAENAQLLGVLAPNHAVLVDASGGRGQSPSAWKAPSTNKRVGFAGGLGPDNLRDELPKIAAIADGDYWIDMEGKLRDSDDWFSVERAVQVMEICAELRMRLGPSKLRHNSTQTFAK